MKITITGDWESEGDEAFDDSQVMDALMMEGVTDIDIKVEP